jgi:hypothetical protein
MEKQPQPPSTSTVTPGLWERPGPGGAPSLEELDLQIGELAAQIDAASYRLLVAIAAFDRRQGWAHAGARSCAHWLSFRIGLSLGTARDHVRVARRLEELPRISAAFAVGKLSYSKVRALARIATPESEEELVATALSCTASQLERLVQAYRQVGRAGLETAQRQQEGRYLRVRYDDDGSLLLDGRLPPEVGAVVKRALEVARAELERTQAAEAPNVRGLDVPAETRRGGEAGDAGQRRADALGLVAEQALMQLGSGERGEPYHVVVHVEAEVMATAKPVDEEEKAGGPALTEAESEGPASAGAAEGQCHVEGGPSLSAETVRRLCCDAPEIELSESRDGEPLSLGRKSRRVSRALWRALRSRDQTCAFPGCERSGVDALNVHHVRHWADGGETSLENTSLFCRRCHWLLHEGGFSVRGHAPDKLVFENPAGQRLPDHYQPPELPADPVAALRAKRLEQGLVITGTTNLIDWWGEPMDLGLAVHGLLPKQDREPVTPVCLE